MICSRCNKSIKLRKEIQIEDSIICKECFEKIIARCNTCYEPIYQNDLIYQISVSWGAEYIISASKTRNITQCLWCYKQLKNEVKKETKWQRWWKKWKRWVLGIIVMFCVILLLILGLPLFYPDLFENWKKTHCFARLLLIALLFITPTTIFYLVVSEFSSKYEEKAKQIT